MRPARRPVVRETGGRERGGDSVELALLRLRRQLRLLQLQQRGGLSLQLGSPGHVCRRGCVDAVCCGPLIGRQWQERRLLLL